jgi:hypothetical protein
MRKQCKRKVYKLVNPIEFAMNGARFMDQNDLRDLRIREFTSLDNITKGKGTVQDWSDLVACLNLTEVMAMNGIGPEAMDTCMVAQRELEAAAKRYETTKRIVLTGVGIQAVRDMLEYANLQQTSIPRSQFEQMVDKTKNMMVGKGKNVVEIT